MSPVVHQMPQIKLDPPIITLSIRPPICAAFYESHFLGLRCSRECSQAAVLPPHLLLLLASAIHGPFSTKGAPSGAPPNFLRWVQGPPSGFLWPTEWLHRGQLRRWRSSAFSASGSALFAMSPRCLSTDNVPPRQCCTHGKH